ncbi:NADH-cytochrome b5 reductase [Rhizoclosmatium sp. JEL0117]|nr:NADH-cytochrome b5 reductase [Rhizoclosmatium sp. JEL0117]KAJ3284348.1 NADH-cytochrome b5 reductase [Rhizoclosmatium sp. JEL0117]
MGASQSTEKKTFLESCNGEYIELVLSEKTAISPNTAIYRLALPSPDTVLGLPIGQHVQVTANVDGKDVTRSYTPISSDDDLGVLDLLVKSYPTGQLSRHFGELKVGDLVKVRGPKGNFKYQANLVKTLGMIAGGTGITPMLQIIKASLKDPKDNTKLNLIFANVSPSDILLKSELDELAASNPRFSVYYVLNKPEEGWTGGVGFVTKEMVEKHAATPGDAKILLCGPPPMIQAMQKYAEELGFGKAKAVSKMEDDIFKF